MTVTAMLDQLPLALQEPPVLVFTAALGLLALIIILRLTTSAKQGKSAAKSKPEPRGYTRAEVAAHNTEGDCWLLIKNRGSDRLKVYDISEYAEMHPGGDAIYKNAGKDATEGFHGPQHPPTVFDLIDEYCIGWLTEE